MTTSFRGRTLLLSPRKSARYWTSALVILSKSLILRAFRSESTFLRPSMKRSLCSPVYVVADPICAIMAESSEKGSNGQLFRRGEERRTNLKRDRSASGSEHLPESAILSKCWNSQLAPFGHWPSLSTNGQMGRDTSILEL